MVQLWPPCLPPGVCALPMSSGCREGGRQGAPGGRHITLTGLLTEGVLLRHVCPRWMRQSSGRSSQRVRPSGHHGSSHRCPGGERPGSEGPSTASPIPLAWCRRALPEQGLTLQARGGSTPPASLFSDRVFIAPAFLVSPLPGWPVHASLAL